MGAPLTSLHQFELARAYLCVLQSAQISEVSVPFRILRAKDISPKILHAPMHDEVLENNAMRASFLLNSLLLTLAAREIKSEQDGSTDTI